MSQVYKTPNVYVEELSLIPPSVAEVSTAIPVFIGYTAKNFPTSNAELAPVRVSSLLEYETIFGRQDINFKSAVNFSIKELSSYALADFTAADLQKLKDIFQEINSAVATKIKNLTPDNAYQKATFTPSEIDKIQAVLAISTDTEASGLSLKLVKAQTLTTPLINDLDPNHMKDYVISTDSLESVAKTDPDKLMLYYNMRLFFANGGGSCYIISVGKSIQGQDPVYDSTSNSPNLYHGLEAVGKVDEPTLIVCPDAVNLGVKYANYVSDALSLCHDLKDRFAILDVVENNTLSTTSLKIRESAQAFRNISVDKDHLKYGAAYYPFLLTNLAYAYQDADTKVEYEFEYVYKDDSNEDVRVKVTIPLSISKLQEEYRLSTIQSSIIYTRENTENHAYEPFTPTVTPNFDHFNVLKNTEIYNKIKAEIAGMRPVLPPSAAIAGIYARVDREQGVWKAPANVSLASVIAPTIQVNDQEQEDLNINAVSGKSINAIRRFSGKGTRVWGARTLDGNSNEWRYVSVRRLFNFIEESLMKATSYVVFEPNTAQTWLKLSTQIESFLTNLWERGALAGVKPSEAFFVHVGLGKSMTQKDVLEGRLIVEIGIAAVRPAEFVILRFSHKLQES